MGGLRRFTLPTPYPAAYAGSVRFTNDTRNRRRVGQRVVVRMYPDSLIPERRRGHPGVVEALDLPGQPPGVLVRFDHPVNGVETCYAAYGEVRAT